MLRPSSSIFRGARVLSSSDFKQLVAVINEMKLELKADTAVKFDQLKADNAVKFAEIRADIAELRAETAVLKANMERNFQRQSANFRELGAKIDDFDSFLKSRELFRIVFCVGCICCAVMMAYAFRQSETRSK